MGQAQPNRKLTAKQEAFAHKYIETSSLTAAYEHAYDSGAMKRTTITKKAYELSKCPRVAAYIEQLRANVAQDHKVTASSLMAELEEARQMAIKRENPAAMVAATMGKAKLAGLDREQHGEDGDDARPVSFVVQVVDARKSANA